MLYFLQDDFSLLLSTGCHNLCKNLNIPIFEKNFTLLDTYSADEIFLTGTFGGLTRVESLDGHKINCKNKGSILQVLRDAYEDLVEKY